MATKQSRALRSKQKAKAARIQKQQSKAVSSCVEPHQTLTDTTIAMFDSLPIPPVPALESGEPPIVFLPPLIQAFLKTYPVEQINEDSTDLRDAIFFTASCYLYWGATDENIVPISAMLDGVEFLSSIPETEPLIRDEIRQFLANQV